MTTATLEHAPVAKFPAAWQQTRAVLRGVLDDTKFSNAEYAVTFYMAQRAIWLGSTRGLEARMCDLMPMTGYAADTLGSACSSLVKRGVLKLAAAAVPPNERYKYGRSCVYDLVVPEELIDSRPPTDAGERHLPKDMLGRFSQAAINLGAYTGDRRGVAGAWRVLLAMLGESGTWGRIEWAGSDTALGVTTGSATRRILADIGVTHILGRGHSPTRYQIGDNGCWETPDPSQEPTQLREHVEITKDPPAAENPPDGGDGFSNSRTWPLTTDEVLDEVLDEYNVAATRPLRQQAARLSKECVTRSDLRIYMDAFDEREPRPPQYGPGWVMHRLAQLFEHHCDVYDRVPPVAPPTREEATKAFFEHHRSSVIDMGADELLALYAEILRSRSAPPDIAHQLIDVDNDPWAPLHANPATLAWVADLHAARLGITLTAWISVYLEVLNP